MTSEDPYEYAAQIATGVRTGAIVGDYWSDRDDREEFIRDLYEFSGRHDYLLVKRRKVGPVEDV